jgi:hypothetical protein
MPITIGNTTITGLAVGGMSDNSITEPNINFSGAIINVSTFVSNTRIAPSSSANLTYFTFDVTKRRTNSILVVHGTTTTGGSENHGSYFFVSFGASRVFRGIGDSMTTTGSGFNSPSVGPGSISYRTHSPSGIAAGTVTIGLGIQPIDGSSNRPWVVINPSSSDDSRNNTGTAVVVYEFAT